MVSRDHTGVRKSLPNSDMQERKNKRLLILLFALSCITLAVWWFGRDKDNYLVDKNLFRDYDLKSTNEIVLESSAGKVALTYNGSRWKVNDAFNVNTDMIEVLFATLQQAEPKRPVAVSLQDSIARVLQQNGVKISLSADGAEQKTFVAGGNSSKSQAYFLDTENGIPYIMTIPGYRVYVSGIFELPEGGWRDKFVFGFNWRNFQQLELKFPQKPSDNFVVAMDENYFNVQGLTQVDTTKLNDFLDNVSLLTVDDYINSGSLQDSLSNTEPFVSILVKDISKKEYLLELFLPTNNRQKLPGRINGTQWALFQQNRVREVIRPRNFFEK